MPKPSLIEANTKQLASAYKPSRSRASTYVWKHDAVGHAKLPCERAQLELVRRRVARHHEHRVWVALAHADHRADQPQQVFVGLLGGHRQHDRALAQTQTRPQLGRGRRGKQIAATRGERHDVDPLARNAQILHDMLRAGLRQRQHAVGAASDGRDHDTPQPHRRRLARLRRDDPRDVRERHDVDRACAQRRGHGGAVQQIHPPPGDRAEQRQLAERLQSAHAQQRMSDQLDRLAPALPPQVLAPPRVAEHAELDIRREPHELRHERAYVRVEAAHARLEEDRVDADARRQHLNCHSPHRRRPVGCRPSASTHPDLLRRPASCGGGERYPHSVQIGSAKTRSASWNGRGPV